MQPIFFSAALKAEDGQLLETGVAGVAADGSILFKNEFIPLLRMGTKVQIARLLGEEEVQLLGGEVYLSSKKLLKVTSVDEKTVEEALRIFGSNVSAPVKLVLKDSNEPGYRAGDILDGSVYYLSPQVIKVSSMEQIEPGHRFTLDLQHPVRLKKLPLKVEQRVPFGRMATGYLCRIEGRISAKLLSALEDYEASQPAGGSAWQPPLQTELSSSF